MTSHVCVLQERFDPSSKMIRWSLSRKEICFCLGVVAPQESSGRRCSKIVEDDADILEDLWFTDDSLLLVNRNNWTPGNSVGVSPDS